MLIEPLPSKGDVLRACRGHENTAHPLLRAAHELTGLHERGADDSRDRTGCRRADLVHQIDRWVYANLPPAHGSASVHTETLGTVIDRIAEYTACAYTALANPSDHALGDAWERLAELAVAYEDLTAELTTGRRRLPGGP